MRLYFQGKLSIIKESPAARRQADIFTAQTGRKECENMDLQALRREIDRIDGEILELFVKRMHVAEQVADYKKNHSLPVLQPGREEEVLNHVRELAPDSMADGAAVLFSGIMDISKSIQQQKLAGGSFPASLFCRKEPSEIALFSPESARKIGCQGVSGAYQEKACKKLFGDKPIVFFPSFEAVFKAVEAGEIDFGVLPIQNSTAGSVTETYDLMRKYNFFIAARVQIEITHCLAARTELPLPDIEAVYSKDQALAQCSDFLAAHDLAAVACPNTAEAAKLCRDSGRPIAAVCSEDCARQYGLHILQTGVANEKNNYTRFICITRRPCLPREPKIVSVSLVIPNVPGSLHRLLSRFAVGRLDLEHLESRVIPNSGFDMMFYLDFRGDIRAPEVASLLEGLRKDLPVFKFLGNYGEIL